MIVVVVAAAAAAERRIAVVQAKAALQNGLNERILAEYHRQSRELSALISLDGSLGFCIPYWPQGDLGRFEFSDSDSTHHAHARSRDT